jgi:hypothetical protein
MAAPMITLLSSFSVMDLPFLLVPLCVFAFI